MSGYAWITLCRAVTPSPIRPAAAIPVRSQDLAPSPSSLPLRALPCYPIAGSLSVSCRPCIPDQSQEPLPLALPSLFIIPFPLLHLPASLLLRSSAPPPIGCSCSPPSQTFPGCHQWNIINVGGIGTAVPPPGPRNRFRVAITLPG